MYIFDIKRYAINDGPGIRTTIFMKGCPLRCVWCHNPEGWTDVPQIVYKPSKCIGCGTCVDVCPVQVLKLKDPPPAPPDRNNPPPTPPEREGGEVRSNILEIIGRRLEVIGGQCPNGCHRCTDACPTTALEICGRAYTMASLMAEIEKERTVMEDSGGGVTLCGGEPLMHAEETLELLRELGRRGFHRTVDTTLYARPEVVTAVAETCELLLVDLKLMDSEKHRLYTGVGNELILENIRRIAQGGYRFQIRIPLIEGINADEENIEATGRFLGERRTGVTVNLLPYHDVGRDKHRRMWSTYNPQGYRMETPTDATIERCRELLEAHGLRVIIGG